MASKGLRRVSGLAVVVLAGCGGGGGDDNSLSRTEIVKQANAACSAATVQARKYVTENAAPETAADTAKAYTDDAAIQRRLAARLGALEPPAEKRDDFEQLVTAEKSVASGLQKSAGLAESGSVEQLQATGKELLDATGKAKSAAKAYGLSECPGHPIVAERSSTSEGGDVATFTDAELGMAISYPSIWHQKEVTDDPNAVAFGDATNSCAFFVTKDRPALTGGALTADLRDRVARAKAGADAYKLIELTDERNVHGLRGGGIVRVVTKDGEKIGGHVAFLFGNGNRYTVDCQTKNPSRLDDYDKNLFRPIIITIRPTVKPKD